MQRPVDEELFNSWLDHPCTEAFMQLLENNAQAQKDLASEGGCMTGRNFEEIGQSYVLAVKTRMVYETLLEDMQDFGMLFPPVEESEDGEGKEDIGRPDTDQEGSAA